MLFSVEAVSRPTVPSLQRDTLSLSLMVQGTSELTAVCGGNCRGLGCRIETERHFGLSTWDKVVLPPYQKDGYTLLRETYLKTPDDYRDSNYTIQN